MASDGDLVKVHYHGTLDGGEVFDSSRGRTPLAFVIGGGQVIAGFENAVRALSPGETATVRIEPAQAYGEHDPELVYEAPRGEAPDGIAEGKTVMLTDRRAATVLELTEDVVRLDANHPLAGKALTFEIELLSVEPARPA